MGWVGLGRASEGSGFVGLQNANPPHPSLGKTHTAGIVAAGTADTLAQLVTNSVLVGHAALISSKCQTGRAPTQRITLLTEIFLLFFSQLH